MKISEAVRRVAKQFKKRECKHVLYSGHGNFLIDDALERLRWNVEQTRLSDRLGPSLSMRPPAHAVAVLASEQVP